MVNQNEEAQVAPVQAPLPETDTGTDEFQPDINPLISEVDKLNSVPDIDISEPVEDTSVPEQPVAEETTTEETTTEEPIVPEPQPQLSNQQIAELQRQAAEYEQVRQRAAVQQEETRIRQQLESQGATSEDAQLQARQYVQGQNAQQDLMKQADAYGQHIAAKQNAAEHFANKYNLTIADLPILKQAENPEIMEALAKEMVERRKIETELATLRKAQVPAQQFDNSQGAPEVASSDGNWLDRYNAGDRSSNAVAAAKRVMGIQ